MVFLKKSSPTQAYKNQQEIPLCKLRDEDDQGCCIYIRNDVIVEKPLGGSELSTHYTEMGFKNRKICYV